MDNTAKAISVVLTEQQNQAIDMVYRLFADGSRMAHIKGSAGTGKTTLVKELAKASQFGKVILAAPTHKAAKVLQAKTGRMVRTIHSLMGMTIVDVEDRQELVQSKAVKFKNNTLLVIDEASMISAELMGIVQGVVNSFPRMRVLFIGDPYQLNPIGESPSTAFNTAGVELTQIMRQQQGSPIIELAQFIRTAVNLNINDLRQFHNGDTIIVGQNRQDWLNNTVSASRTAIAWRNSRVAEINAAARFKLFGEESRVRPYMVGETVITYAPLMLNKTTLLENSAEVVITGVVPCQWRGFSAYQITCQEAKFYAVHDPVELDEYLKRAAAKAKALPSPQRGICFRTEFFAVRDSFLDIRPSHAMTSHKSQGSTFAHVAVDANDIFINRTIDERVRSLYVAVSRASESVSILI